MFEPFRVCRPAHFQEPRISGVCMIAGGKGCFRSNPATHPHIMVPRQGIALFRQVPLMVS